jgi:hypothetical protein
VAGKSGERGTKIWPTRAVEHDQHGGKAQVAGIGGLLGRQAAGLAAQGVPADQPARHGQAVPNPVIEPNQILVEGRQQERLLEQQAHRHGHGDPAQEENRGKAHLPHAPQTIQKAQLQPEGQQRVVAARLQDQPGNLQPAGGGPGQRRQAGLIHDHAHPDVGGDQDSEEAQQESGPGERQLGRGAASLQRDGQPQAEQGQAVQEGKGEGQVRRGKIDHASSLADGPRRGKAPGVCAAVCRITDDPPLCMDLVWRNRTAKSRL